jgi:hypothetical protein
MKFSQLLMYIDFSTKFIRNVLFQTCRQTFALYSEFKERIKFGVL